MDVASSTQQRRFCQAKTRVQKLTRTSILGHSHTKAKIVVAFIGVVVVPFTDDAVLRVIVPTTSAFDAVRTGAPLLSPYRLTLRLFRIHA